MPSLFTVVVLAVLAAVCSGFAPPLGKCVILDRNGSGRTETESVCVREREGDKQRRRVVVGMNRMPIADRCGFGSGPKAIDDHQSCYDPRTFTFSFRNPNKQNAMWRALLLMLLLLLPPWMQRSFSHRARWTCTFTCLHRSHSHNQPPTHTLMRTDIDIGINTHSHTHIDTVIDIAIDIDIISSIS